MHMSYRMMTNATRILFLTASCMCLIALTDANAIAGDSIHNAAMEGNLVRIKQLLKSNPKLVNEKGGKNHMTPLHCAAAFCHPKVVEYLLSSGANVNTQDIDGYTSIHWATGTSKLITAGGSYEDRVAVVKLLINKKAFINAQGLGGYTPIMLAAEWNEPEIVSYLLKKGANPTLQTSDENGVTALHIAAGNDDDTDIVSLLLAGGAKINTPDKHGMTALHYAVGNGYCRKWAGASEELIQYLIQKGADVNAKNFEGGTPIHFAITYGNNAIVELLIDSGANINLVIRDGKSALDIAKLNHRDSLSDLMIALGLGKDSDLEMPRLHYAARSGWLKAAVKLIAAGANVNEIDSSGKTPLHLAAAHGKHYLCDLLLKHGAQVDIRIHCTGSYPTPLFEAISHCTLQYSDGIHTRDGYLETIKILVERGADVNACCYGHSIIEMAHERRASKAIVNYLISAGAKQD